MAYRTGLIEQRLDEKFMRMALRLARQPVAPPYPNPWVGCVVARAGKVVGRGYHRGPGANHAEVEALAQAGPRAKGATLYVTLEPCCHFGRTPPCTDAIIEAGIHRVVYALRDPNPLVCGRGASILKRNGILIQGGVLTREAAALNEVYLKFRQTGLPFVTAKVAASLDGKIATRTGDSKWITGAPARRCARLIRAQNQAVLVGINTVLADDPHLGPRLKGAANPWRVVLDSRLRIPTDALVVRSGRCIVAAGAAAASEKRKALVSAGAEVWMFHGSRAPLHALLLRLAARGVLSVMIEGGGEVLGAAFDGGLVDRLFWFVSPVIIGSRDSRAAVAGKGATRLTDATRLHQVSLETVGSCWLLRGNASRWALS